MKHSLLMSLLLVTLMLLPFVTMASETTNVPKFMNGLPLVFSETFDDGADKWEPTDPSTWKITKDGERTVFEQTQKKNNYKPPVRSPFHRAMLKEVKVADFVIETMMKSTTPTYGHRDMCLFFGYQDESHFYYVHIAPAKKTDPHANSIFIVNGAPRKSIATKRNNGNSWEDDTYHKVRVERDSKTGTIKVYFKDMKRPVMEAKDDTFKAGRIGVGTFDDTGCIDEIHLWGK